MIMSILRRARLISAVILLLALAAFGQGNYKAESIGAPAASDLPPALASALDSSGARLVNGQGAPVCEVWLRKSVPAKSSGASSDTAYGMGMGMLVGVLRFPADGSDFRGQAIKAGYYTLRYALVPQDGNHMGVSAYRDFLLLSPVAADTQLDQALTFEALAALSKKASGTNHPAVLTMIPATDAGALPAAVHDDQGHWGLQIKAKTAAGDQPLAFILVGKSEAA